MLCRRRDNATADEVDHILCLLRAALWNRASAAMSLYAMGLDRDATTRILNGGHRRG